MKLDDVPEKMKERSKYLLLDGVGCALIGAHLPWSETAADAVFGMEEAGPCTVIGWERGLSPIPAA